MLTRSGRDGREDSTRNRNSRKWDARHQGLRVGKTPYSSSVSRGRIGSYITMSATSVKYNELTYPH